MAFLKQFPFFLVIGLHAILVASDVTLFQDFSLTILRAETNKYRAGVRHSDIVPVPNLYIQVNLIAKRWDGVLIGRETFYAKTKTIKSTQPIFNETFVYTKKEISNGWVMGTDTIMRINLYEHVKDDKTDEFLGRFEIDLGNAVANDRSNMELMSVMNKGVVGSVIWYKYNYTLFQSVGGMWGSDVSNNWSGNSEEVEEREGDNDYGQLFG